MSFQQRFQEAISREEQAQQEHNCPCCMHKQTITKTLADLVDTESDSEQDVCAVCFESSEKGHTFKCGHRYHVDCIKEWIKQKPDGGCPKCRASTEDMLGLEKPKSTPISYNNAIGVDVIISQMQNNPQGFQFVFSNAGSIEEESFGRIFRQFF